MERVKLTANFYLDEYIPKELYVQYANKLHILVGLLDKRLVIADQKLVDVFGSALINTWWNGGDRNWSGLRTPDSSYFSSTSQHSFGRASDKVFLRATADEVREYIKLHWQELGITCIEDNVSWVHSDCRFVNNQSKILIVQP